MPPPTATSSGRRARPSYRLPRRCATCHRRWRSAGPQQATALGSAICNGAGHLVQGRIANATFGDYLVPVHADVPDIDVTFVGEPDRFSPRGAKGLGEVGTVGVSAAVANAVYHAIGRRIRSLPITFGQTAGLVEIVEEKLDSGGGVASKDLLHQVRIALAEGRQ